MLKNLFGKNVELEAAKEVGLLDFQGSEQLTTPPLTVFATNKFEWEAPTITVPPGYALYVVDAINNGWTDNKNVGQRPLEGFEHPNEDEMWESARRAALVGVRGENNEIYVASYTPDVDRSRGGSMWWPNNGNSHRTYYWLMNDSQVGYDDNDGTAVVRFGLHKLPRS